MKYFIKKLAYYPMVAFVCVIALCITVFLFIFALFYELGVAFHRWVTSSIYDFKPVFMGVFISLCGGMNGYDTPPQTSVSNAPCYRGNVDNDFV